MLRWRDRAAGAAGRDSAVGRGGKGCGLPGSELLDSRMELVAHRRAFTALCGKVPFESSSYFSFCFTSEVVRNIRDLMFLFSCFSEL